ncbi:MAG: penicillin acylase family protein [Thermodesulfobacteriota bacterium]
MRRLLFPLLALCLLGTGCAGFLNKSFQDSLPEQSGTVALPGIEKGAVIRRDAMGIPFISAENEYDLCFAKGYADAADRLSQMLGQALAAQGRLAEMAGPEALGLDLFMRTINLKGRADKAYADSSADLKKVLDAYAKGVNAYIWTHRDHMPFDLALSGYKPDPWRPQDSFYIFSLLDMGLSMNMCQELGYLTVAKRVGPEKAVWLTPIYPDEPICFSEAKKISAKELAALPGDLSGLSGFFAGFSALSAAAVPASNNWAVSGTNTVSGAALLANDTHLPISMPSLWTLVHMRCKGFYDAAGISLPGVPGVVAGTNGRVAWGMTMVMSDNQDIFLEQLKMMDGKLHYLHEGRWCPTAERPEKFDSSDGKSVIKVVHETVHGPLINDALAYGVSHPLMPDAVDLPFGLALAWDQAEKDMTFDGFLDIARAENMAQARAAMAKIRGMGLNMLYADRDHIAWQVTGVYPVRKAGRGLLPSPGWSGEYDWQGQLDFSSLPHAEDPETGYLATANNRTVPADFPHILSSSWFAPDRVNRIVRLLSAEQKKDAKACFTMQYDQVSPRVEKVKRVLFNSECTDEIVRIINTWPNPAWRKQAREASIILRRMDGNLSADSLDAAVFESFLNTVTLNLFGDELGPLDGPVWKAFVNMEAVSYGATEDHICVRGDESPFWDDTATKQKEKKAEILAKSLADCIAYLEQKLGKDRRDWTWGKLHKYSFETETSKMGDSLQFFKRMGLRAISGYLNAGPFPAGGDHSTINVSGYLLGRDFATWYIPEMRMVVDFGQEEPLYLMNSTGQSGNPASPHYRDGIFTWLSGDYNHMPFAPAAVEKKYANVLTLEPKY